MSEGVRDKSDDMIDPGNLRTRFGILMLSFIERDIQPLPVWKPHLVFPVSIDVRIRVKDESDDLVDPEYV
jgi:hypothetical protein